MTTPKPRIGYPQLGTPTADALRAADVSLSAQPALPTLLEPPETAITNPIEEPMVRVETVHRRIEVIAHYSLGGWKNSIDSCWLRPEVALRLASVADSLPDRFGLVIYDGWRPRALQEELYTTAFADPSVPPGFLAEPSQDINHPAPHETGGAVDLTLSIDNVPLAPGTDFDNPTSLAFAASLEHSPGADREARRMLYWAMRAADFAVYKGEWWHFEYGTRRWSSIVGQPAVYGATAPP